MAEVKTTWAMPSVATVWIVASLCFGLFALLAGIVPMAGMPVLNAWLMAGSVGLFLCAVIEFVRGEIVLGTITMVFAPLIALGGGHTFNTILAAPSLEAMGAEMALSGWVWLAIGILFFLFLPALAKVSWSLFLMMIELGVGIILIAVAMMTGTAVMGAGLMLIAGWLILFFAVYLMYVGLVFLTNTVYAAPKLSIGGPIVK